MKISSENFQEVLDQEWDQIPKTPSVKMKKMPPRKVLKWLISSIAVLLVLAILVPVINGFVIPSLKLFVAEALIEGKQYELAYYLLKQCENNDDAQKLLNNFEVTYDYQKTAVYKEDDTLYRTVIIEHNSDGDITYEVAFNKDSKTVYTRNYLYDQYGNLIEEEYCTGAYTRSNKTEYVYGENGNILEMTRYFPNEEHTRVINSKYDERGNLIEQADYYPAGKLLCRYMYTYDENDNCILYIADSENDNDGVLREETVYDENGNVIMETNYHDDEYVSHLEYTYTSNGKIKSEALFKTTVLSHKTEYTYDSQDNLIEVQNFNSSGTSKTVYKYDFRGNKIQEESYKNNSLERKYTYKYDIRGNLLNWNGCDEDGNVIRIQQQRYNLLGNKTKEVHFNAVGEEYEKIEMKYGLLGNISKRREYINGNLQKEYAYDHLGNMTKMYVDAYFDEFAIYDLQEIGKLIVEYGKPIILYKPEA